MDALIEQAKAEGEVDWASTKPQSQMQGAIDLFEKKYPGIKVNFAGTKAADQISQLKVQRAARKVAIDVADAGELSLTQTLSFAADIDWGQYGIDDQYLAFDKKMIYVLASPKVWVYNTKEIDPSAVPKSWNDILKMEVMGSEISLDSRGSFMNIWNVDSSLGAKEGLAWAERLAAKKPHYATNLPEAEQQVETGQAAIGSSLINLALDGQASGAPVKIAPVSPTSTNETYIYVTDGAPHPAAAVLLSTFLSSDEAQQQIAKHDNARIPRNTDCSESRPNAVVKTMCSLGISWKSTGDADAYASLTVYFADVQRALGTAAN